MNEEQKRLRRVCFRGHRPNKMKFKEQEIKSLLLKAIDEAIENGYVGLRLICALPHHGFENGKSVSEKMRF